MVSHFSYLKESVYRFVLTDISTAEVFIYILTLVFQGRKRQFALLKSFVMNFTGQANLFTL